MTKDKENIVRDIRRIASNHSPNDIDFIYFGNDPIIRNVQRELGSLGYYVNGDEGNYDFTTGMIVSTQRLMNERFDTLKQYNCADFMEYNQKIAHDGRGNTMCSVVIIIDDAKALVESLCRDSVEMLTQIISDGYPVGIHFIMDNI